MAKYVEILKGNLILAKAKYLDHFLPKVRGLMFAKPLLRGKGVVLVASHESILDSTIHMLFVFFPIDVLFLDKKKRVVEIKKNLKPFTIYNSKRKAQYVIELPAGRIQDKIDIWDKVRI